MRFFWVHIIFRVTLLALAAMVLFADFPIWPVLMLGVLYVGLLAWGSANIRSSFFVPVLWKQGIPSNSISLTFDDGPHPEHTAAILDILKAEGLQATFFCIGREAEKHPELVQRIVADGHQLGNHTYNHPINWGFLRGRNLEEEIARNQAVLKKLSGEEPVYFRPPFGVTMPALGKALKRFPKLRTIGWGLRSLDTVLDEGRTKSRILRQLKPGKLILLHDNRAHTPALLKETIRECRNRGINIVSLRTFLS